VVLAAKDKESPNSLAALNSLCRTYWPPLYSYVRHKGYSEEDSRDLTQEFFAHLLSNDFLKNVARGRGRFRSFLLVSLRNFLINEWRKNRAERRGGATPALPLDFAMAEGRYALADNEDLDPRTLFDRQWAHTILEAALARLGEEYATAGKSNVFENLKGCLDSKGEGIPYLTLAERLNTSEGAVKVAVHRLRKRLTRLLREEIARTVETPEEVEEELRYLVKLLGP
jgi:RNA polymerase sigma-70 factor (ECF subfamily)